MKTLVFYLVLTLFAGVSTAQEITELKEARVGFAPYSSEVKRSGNNFSFKVSESHVGEFEKDPLLFMNNNFNIKNFIAEVRDENYRNYTVTFRSSRGRFYADFNSKGELLRSVSKFDDVKLPRELRHQLYREHKGWAMTGNSHLSKSRKGGIDQNFYKIKLVNGKDRKNIVYHAPAKTSQVASN